MKTNKNPIVITKNQKLRSILNTIEKSKFANVPILITGETGTGKELIAKLIHSKSEKNSFYDLNCSAISEQLIESELFGHVKGSFTGADRNKLGILEKANNGTLFLDEIGYLSYRAQATILRAIETKQFSKVGGTETINSNFRLICATNVNILDKEIFRQDLLYRINTITLNLPPLRQRLEDIPYLVEYFIKKYCIEFKKEKPEIPKSVINEMQRYSWPGNIRELKNVICEAILSSDKELSVKLGNLVREYEIDTKGDLDLDKIEKEAILRALQIKKWIQVDAAKILGITPRILNYKIVRHGITHPKWKKNK